jgi:hypothetical protein
VPGRRQRNSDLKVMLGAATAVLLVGLFIAGALVMTTSGNEVSCGRLAVGPIEEIYGDVEGGPAYIQGGGKCAAWVALEQGDIVAYKVRQPNGCQLLVEDGELQCADGTRVAVDELEEFPVSIETRNDIDTVVVDLSPPLPADAD